MSKASLAMQNLARMLFAIEAKHASPEIMQLDTAERVCEKLRLELTRFAGPVGYSALLSRAWALASAQIPSLKMTYTHNNGHISRRNDSQRNPEVPAGEDRETAGIEIVAQLLGLLVIFIGESLMVTLISDVWPNESFDMVDLNIEVKS